MNKIKIIIFILLTQSLFELMKFLFNVSGLTFHFLRLLIKEKQLFFQLNDFLKVELFLFLFQELFFLKIFYLICLVSDVAFQGFYFLVFSSCFSFQQIFVVNEFLVSEDEFFVNVFLKLWFLSQFLILLLLHLQCVVKEFISEFQLEDFLFLGFEASFLFLQHFLKSWLIFETGGKKILVELWFSVWLGGDVEVFFQEDSLHLWWGEDDWVFLLLLVFHFVDFTNFEEHDYKICWLF